MKITRFLLRTRTLPSFIRMPMIAARNASYKFAVNSVLEDPCGMLVCKEQELVKKFQSCLTFLRLRKKFVVIIRIT